MGCGQVCSQYIRVFANKFGARVQNRNEYLALNLARIYTHVGERLGNKQLKTLGEPGAAPLGLDNAMAMVEVPGEALPRDKAVEMERLGGGRSSYLNLHGVYSFKDVLVAIR